MADLLEKYQILIAAGTIIGGLLGFYILKPKTLREIAENVSSLQIGQKILLGKMESYERQIEAQWKHLDDHGKEIRTLGENIVRIETRCDERSRGEKIGVKL